MKQAFVWKLEMLDSENDYFLATRTDTDFSMPLGVFHVDTLWKTDWSVYDKLAKKRVIEVKVTFEDLDE